MAFRHLSRSIALQTLFEWDIREKIQDPVSILERNLREFGPGGTNDPFVAELVSQIALKQPELDVIIAKSAPDWPIDKIAVSDRNALRIGLYELLFGDKKEVPPKVAINEAIELAKDFGGEASGRFVNGVLGAVYRELGEPGKDDVSKKDPKMSIPDDEAPIEDLVGAVVYSEENGALKVAFVHDVFGHWTLAKGHVTEGEELEAATARVVNDELGLTATASKKVGENSYIAYDPEKGKIKKRVSYFLAKADHAEIALGKKGGLDGARWFAIEEIDGLNFYDDMMPIITKALASLVS